jgi:hypothetical protein
MQHVEDINLYQKKGRCKIGEGAVIGKLLRIHHIFNTSHD